MEIKQLAFVLEQIDQLFTEHALVDATDQLVDALAQVVRGEGTADPINTTRDHLFAIHNEIEQVEWSPEQLALLDSYGGRDLLGQHVIDQINQAFIDNLMNPAAVLAVVQDIRAHAADLHTRARELLAELDPALIDADVVIEEVVEAEYDIIDDETVYANGEGDRNVVKLIRDRLSTTVDAPQPPGEVIPMRVKVMAAVPVAIAVATKALDLYLRSKETKPAVADRIQVGRPVPMPKPSPKQRKPAVNPTATTHYYYRRTVTVTRTEK